MARKQSTTAQAEPAAAETNPPAPTPQAPATPAPDGNGKNALPVWRKRLYSSGSFVECAVFGHEVDQGNASFTAYSVALRRSYKDSDGNWQETRSLRSDDLLVAAHALQRAYAWISEREQS